MMWTSRAAGRPRLQVGRRIYITSARVGSRACCSCRILNIIYFYTCIYIYIRIYVHGY